MSLNEDIKKLCSLSKVEIPDALMDETFEKIKEVLFLFDKLDSFTMNPTDKSTNPMDKTEKVMDSLRDDIPRSGSNSSQGTVYPLKLLNTRNGFLIGPRI